jgi:amino-acid N-acetyltransferase
MATTIRSYYTVCNDDALIGFGALHIYSPEFAEVRSFFNDEAYRGQKIGSQLLSKLEEEAKKLGVKRLLALTYKREFFEKQGFVEIAKEQIPEHKIWADCIKCKHFPICNEISLVKTIQD